MTAPGTPDISFVIMPDADAVAMEAARRLIAHIVANREHPAICLTGGSGPQRLFTLLGQPGYREQIPWQRVHWFIGDERFVADSDKLNNMGIARSIFLNRYAPAENIHPIPTDVDNPDIAAGLYERELQAFHQSSRLGTGHPLFDLVLMGLGPDGHTASLFPGAPALSETHRWAVGVAHANVEPFVPRITLTYPALASCKEMLFLVTGVEKREILSRVKAGADLPAARAHSNGLTTWLVDRAAAGAA